MSDEDWRKSQGVNVFEMYRDHGGAGFWVRRITWGGTCARVVRVGKITGPAPYFGNPSVLMDVYTLDGSLKDAAVALPAAGTFKTWRKIDPPQWAATVALRPLDDPELDTALRILDKKRHKDGLKAKEAPETPEIQRVFLSVSFEKKRTSEGARSSVVAC